MELQRRAEMNHTGEEGVNTVHSHTHKHTHRSSANPSFGPTQCPHPLCRAAPSWNGQAFKDRSHHPLSPSHQSPQHGLTPLRSCLLGLSRRWKATTPRCPWEGPEAMPGLSWGAFQNASHTWPPSNKGIELCGSGLHCYPAVTWFWVAV